MATEHPFQHLFETLGRVPPAHAESVNRRAYEVLTDILTVPVENSGRCILLKAPRAGHGKTHLLARVRHQFGFSHEFIALQTSFSSRVDAASVLDDSLRRLIRQLPASGGLCVLDLVTRRLFSSALQPLVKSGEVPCQDREGALTALRTRPIETFDFHHPSAVTAHWACDNFVVLGHRLSLELAQRSGMRIGGISFWVEALFRFASAPLDNPNRVRVLVDAVHDDNGEPMERLEALLGLLTMLMRVVLVADDVEVFSADETAALRLSAFLGSLRHSVERLDVILSVNQDIWESAFLPRLSGGLADRLAAVGLALEPLTNLEMAALLDSRVPGLGTRVLKRIDVNAAGTHARGLIRAAGIVWVEATAADAANAKTAERERKAMQLEMDPQPLAPVSAAPLVEESPHELAAVAPVAWPEPVLSPPITPTWSFKIIPVQDALVPFETDFETSSAESPVATPEAEPFPEQSPLQITDPQPQPAPPVTDTTRVDELLRQFRARYGHGTT